MRTYRYWLYPVWWSGLGLWGDTKEQCEDGLHLNMGQGLQSVCVCVTYWVAMSVVLHVSCSIFKSVELVLEQRKRIQLSLSTNYVHILYLSRSLRI